MDEYIKKQDTLNKICNENCGKLYDGTCNNCYITQIISEINPAADVRSVVRGEWVEEKYVTISITRGRKISNTKNYCSVCKKSNGRNKFNFCPNCGADMRGEQK